MYRVEWMKKGEKTVYWDGFAQLTLAYSFLLEKLEDENIVSGLLLTPWDIAIW